MLKYNKSLFKMFLVLSFFILLISCDMIVPPYITNGTKNNLIVHIKYDNNIQFKSKLESGELLVNSTRGMSLFSLKIYSEEMVLIAEYDINYINQMRGELKDNEYWVISDEGLFNIPRQYYFDDKWRAYIKSR